MLVANKEIRDKKILLLQASLILALFVLVYHETIGAVIKAWFTSEGAHGILIFGISVYMVWISKDKLLQLDMKPNMVPGIILLIVSGVILLAGKLTVTLIFQEISLITALMALVLMLLGNDYFRILWLPIAYLSFMFPLYEKILNPVSIYFQKSAIWITSIVLSILNIPYLIQDTFIYLSNITLEVTRACSGITHIVALSALVIFWCYMNHSTKRVTAILLFSAFVTGLILNGFRVIIISVWSYYSGGHFSHGPFDIFYTSFIFIAGFGLLVAAYMLMTPLKTKNPQAISVTVPVNSDKSWRIERFKNASFLATALVLIITFFCLFIYRPLPQEARLYLNDFQPVLGQWESIEMSGLQGNFKFTDADALVKRIYKSKDGDKVELYIAYFKIVDEGRGINNSD